MKKDVKQSNSKSLNFFFNLKYLISIYNYNYDKDWNRL